MEINNSNSLKKDDEDRISILTDDILLSIVGRVDITTAARTSVLSGRWKHLPWLLHDLTIDVEDFLPIPHPKPIEAEHMDEAMASLTKAIWSFLATSCRENTISSLQLKLYLVNNYSDIIGPLISKAADTGNLKDLYLAIVDEKEPEDCLDEEMLQQARAVDGFFRAYPSVIHCLTRLSLYNVCFAQWDMHHFLFDCCKQLRHLCLSNCDMGGLSTWKIHAPESNLSSLELGTCCLGKVELWMLIEGKQLCSAFSKLRKLSLLDIFVEFDLLWMLVLLEAAPSVEIFDFESFASKIGCLVDAVFSAS